MAKNAKHWKTFVASKEDKELKAKTGVDPLEEGLKDMGWFANSKRIVAKGIKRTQETFGEEVGNSITAGVMALFLLCILPFAAVDAYTSAPVMNNDRPVPARELVVLSVSAFIITLFLSLLISTIFHFMKHVCALILPVVSGSVIWALEAACAVAGTLVTAITYPQSKTGNVFSKLIYVIMGWMILARIFVFYNSTTKLCFWLIISGSIAYSVGLWFNFGKKFKFSHMVWHLFVLGASVLHLLGFVFFFAY